MILGQFRLRCLVVFKMMRGRANQGFHREVLNELQSY
jgi:hypothetical protein